MGIKKEFERIKIFESGNYPQGDYPKEKVKSIFEKVTDDIKGIFMHTSRLENSKHEEKQLATINDFYFDEKGDNVTVYANIEFNEDGAFMKDRGFLSGVSVELPDDKLTKIAILPIGLKPAISGAEFEEKKVFFTQFEEINNNNNIEGGKKMGNEEIITALATLKLEEKMRLAKTLSDSLSTEDIKLLRKTLNITSEWEDMTIDVKKRMFEKAKVEFAEQPKFKTEAEIREEIKAEFQEKDRLEKETKEFEKLVDEKVIPAYRQEMKILGRYAIADKGTVEFEEAGEKKSLRNFEKVKSLLENKTGLDISQNLEISEFERKETTIESETKKFKEMQK